LKPILKSITESLIFWCFNSFESNTASNGENILNIIFFVKEAELNVPCSYRRIYIGAGTP
jgi:hypothetical protein